MSAFNERQERFIKAVAAYVTSAIGVKSIRLQMGDDDAKKWAAAYSASGCIGYDDAEAAEKSIRRILQPPQPATPQRKPRKGRRG